MNASFAADNDEFVEEVRECMTRRNDMAFCLSLAKVTSWTRRSFDVERRAANIAPDRQQEFDCLQKLASWDAYGNCHPAPPYWPPASERLTMSISPRYRTQL